MTRTAHPRSRAAAVGLTAASLVLAGCSGGTDDGGQDGNGASDTVVLSTFPFGVEEFQEAVIDPFTEKTGIEVVVETGSNADRVSQLQLADGDPGIDVMLISDYYAALAQDKGLFQELDAGQVPNLETIADFAVEDAYHGPAYSYQLNGTMYRTDELDAETAADWELYGDEQYAGRVALPDISVTAGQLMISGVAETYGDGPYDIDTAYAKLGEWAPGILQFYSSTTEVTNLLTQGEIIAADTISGFATDLVASDEPIAWTAPAEGRFMATNRAMIPDGAPNAEGAHAFVDYLLSAEAQTSSAELVGDLPVNPEATVPTEVTDVVGDIADDPVAAGYQTLDPTQLVPNRDEWVERFAREVSGA
ncbi:ABC transporter substrate-binding protein [Georgenia halophila]|uniref:ABC transporter substrate-binding protein n=1 Tax=Georgenia halophila TaxID=620889 RepID=A0ABP8LP12_9MICO